MKDPEEVKLVENWLRFARENLLFAKVGIKEKSSLYHSICFMCQGSAEKYLKAFLIWKGWELKKIHDLNDLLAFCVDFEPEFESLKGKCSLLMNILLKLVIQAICLLKVSMKPML